MLRKRSRLCSVVSLACFLVLAAGKGLGLVPVLVTVAASANPATVNQTVTLTATVSVTSGGTPTGTVTFEFGYGGIIGTAPLSGGKASLAKVFAISGTKSIIAIYSGDAGFAGGTSATFSQIVNTAATTTSISSSSNPDTVNQPVTLTAAVASLSGGGTPTGTVTFEFGYGGIIGTAAVAWGHASLSAVFAKPGTKSIIAIYSGDSNFAASTSSVFSQIVNQAATTTKLTSSPNPAVSGQAVTLTATVTSQTGVGTATGTVTFEFGYGGIIGTATLNGGQASLSKTFSVVGMKSITAVYSGDANFASSSGLMTEAVNNTSGARAYTTSFPLTENLISEGGNWLNGLTNGMDWGDVRTTPRLAFGTNAGNFADATAVLSGNWGPDQVVQGIVHSVNQTDALFEEVELRLRTTIAPHTITGYEVNYRCSKTGNAYSQIVKWNGALGDFTPLTAVAGAGVGVRDGDAVKATMVGNLITVYLNGVQINQWADTNNPFLIGNPGIGFYLDQGSTQADYGFTSFAASDGASLASTLALPAAPGNLTATTVGASQINIGWSPSASTVGLAYYFVQRCQGVGCSNFAQIAAVTGTNFSDTSLLPGTSYSYQVQAVDVVGNASVFSTPARTFTAP